MEEELGSGGVEEDAALALAMVAREGRGYEVGGGGGRGWKRGGEGRSSSTDFPSTLELDFRSPKFAL